MKKKTCQADCREAQTYGKYVDLMNDVALS